MTNTKPPSGNSFKEKDEGTSHTIQNDERSGTNDPRFPDHDRRMEPSPSPSYGKSAP